MRRQPVAVAHRSLSRIFVLVSLINAKLLKAGRPLWVVLFSVLALAVFAGGDPEVTGQQPFVILDDGGNSPEIGGYLARIQLNSPAEVEAALLRAEQIYLQGELAKDVGPVAFVLHGPEVAIFFRDNYSRFKPIIDLAARLSAFQVIEVKVCETRMGVLGRDRSELFPFVGTVPFGPREVQQLLENEQYVYF